MKVNGKSIIRPFIVIILFSSTNIAHTKEQSFTNSTLISAFGEAIKDPTGAIWSDRSSESMTFHQGTMYCKELGARLPTRAEWVQYGKHIGIGEVEDWQSKHALTGMSESTGEKVKYLNFWSGDIVPLLGHLPSWINSGEQSYYFQGSDGSSDHTSSTDKKMYARCILSESEIEERSKRDFLQQALSSGDAYKTRSGHYFYRVTSSHGLGNDTFRDVSTNLIWGSVRRESHYIDAKAQCAQMNARLPDRSEYEDLAGYLYEEGEYNYMVMIPGWDDQYYWTKTTSSITGGAFYIFNPYENKFRDSHDNKTWRGYRKKYRCVKQGKKIRYTGSVQL